MFLLPPAKYCEVLGKHLPRPLSADLVPSHLGNGDLSCVSKAREHSASVSVNPRVTRAENVPFLGGGQHQREVAEAQEMPETLRSPPRSREQGSEPPKGLEQVESLVRTVAQTQLLTVNRKGLSANQNLTAADTRPGLVKEKPTLAFTSFVCKWRMLRCGQEQEEVQRVRRPHAQPSIH